MHGPPLPAALASAAFALFAVWTPVLSAADIRERRLPNLLLLLATSTTLPMLLASAAASALAPASASGAMAAASTAGAPGERSAIRLILDTLGPGAAAGVLLAALWWWAPAGIGGGDVKLAPLIGAVTGFAAGWVGAALALTAAFGFAALSGALLRLRRPRARGADDRGVPFAPCLFAGAWAVVWPAVACV
ncbi:hypothetical protein ACWGOE_01150 [Leucobacter chromiiresistens]